MVVASLCQLKVIL